MCDLDIWTSLGGFCWSQAPAVVWSGLGGELNSQEDKKGPELKGPLRVAGQWRVGGELNNGSSGVYCRKKLNRRFIFTFNYAQIIRWLIESVVRSQQQPNHDTLIPVTSVRQWPCGDQFSSHSQLPHYSSDESESPWDIHNPPVIVSSVPTVTCTQLENHLQEFLA